MAVKVLELRRGRHRSSARAQVAQSWRVYPSRLLKRFCSDECFDPCSGGSVRLELSAKPLTYSVYYLSCKISVWAAIEIIPRNLLRVWRCVKPLKGCLESLLMDPLMLHRAERSYERVHDAYLCNANSTLVASHLNIMSRDHVQCGLFPGHTRREAPRVTIRVHLRTGALSFYH